MMTWNRPPPRSYAHGITWPSKARQGIYAHRRTLCRQAPNSSPKRRATLPRIEAGTAMGRTSLLASHMSAAIASATGGRPHFEFEGSGSHGVALRAGVVDGGLQVVGNLRQTCREQTNSTQPSTAS